MLRISDRKNNDHRFRRDKIQEWMKNFEKYANGEVRVSKGELLFQLVTIKASVTGRRRVCCEEIADFI